MSDFIVKKADGSKPTPQEKIVMEYMEKALNKPEVQKEIWDKVLKQYADARWDRLSYWEQVAMAEENRQSMAFFAGMLGLPTESYSPARQAYGDIKGLGGYYDKR